MVTALDLDQVTMPGGRRLGDRLETAFVEATSELKPKYKKNAGVVFMKRYSRKDAQGEPTESPEQAHWRVCLNVAAPTVFYVEGADWEEGDTEPSPVNAHDLDFPFRTLARQYNWYLARGRKLKEFSELVYNGLDEWLTKAERYYSELLAILAFIPNSPTWTGAGTLLGQLAACFVLPVADSLVAGQSSIMKTLQDAVAIQKTGGGNGFSFGRLRPARSRVSTSMGEATGVVGFLSMYNDVFEHIRQGGSRRGANMGVCPVWHPDVIDFINAKTVEGKIANFNISVAITDDFMEAVKNDAPWQFRFPGPDGPVHEVEWAGEMVKEVPARELFDLIVTNAHVIGDPGALFIDTANRDNPCPKHYTLESTNPCGEQWLGPYENCCLGSIAVQSFVHDGRFDWEHFRKVIVLATEFLDDVVDANAYVDAVPELEEAAQNGRRIGLGQMGLADALIQMGLRYGSEAGNDFSSQLTEFMRYHAMLTSIERAKERGSFPWIKESIYDPDLIREYGWGEQYQGTMVDGETPFTGWTWDVPKPFQSHTGDFGRPECDWSLVQEGILNHGIRNSAQSTFAPTGTIATTAGVEGYGCEPIYALSYKRTVMQEGENILLDYPSELFEFALRREGLDEEELREIAKLVEANGGSCQGIDLVPEALQKIFVVSADLSGEEHVRMQATLQAWIDNSISKTINLPESATVEDVRDAYAKADDWDCKGITVYRQGSRELEVLSTATASETGTVEVMDEDHWPIVKPLPIPEYAEADGMLSRTFTVRTPFGKMRATFTHKTEHPFRLFDAEVKIGRGGSDVNAFTEAIGRLASLNFRSGVHYSDVADQIIGIGGQTREETLRPDKSVSVADAFGKLILRYGRQLEEAERQVGTVTLVGPPMTVSEFFKTVNEVTRDGMPSVEKLLDMGAKVINKSQLCPDCHQATLAFLQGCIQCTNQDAGCTYNKCG